MTTKQFLNQIDLSRRWGISARTLEQWRWRGEGPPFVKIGCRVRYRIEDVEQYEQRHILTCTGQTIPSNTDETAKPKGDSNV